MAAKIRIGVYLDESLKEDLVKLADLDGRSMSSYIEWAVKENIKKARKQGVIND